MYNDVGKKVKILAQILGWLSLIAGIIVFLVLICNQTEDYSRYSGYYKVYNTADDGIAFAALVVGFLGFISSWFIYGFGQLIEDTETIKEATVAMHIANHKASVNNAPMNSKNQTKIDSAFCVNCGAKRDGNSSFCTSCGQRF